MHYQATNTEEVEMTEDRKEYIRLAVKQFGREMTEDQIICMDWVSDYDAARRMVDKAIAG